MGYILQLDGFQIFCVKKKQKHWMHFLLEFVCIISVGYESLIHGMHFFINAIYLFLSLEEEEC